MNRVLKYCIALTLGAACMLIIAAQAGCWSWGERKVDNYYAAMRADLRNLISAESSFYKAHGRFTTSFDSMGFSPSAGVGAEITSASAAAWGATVTHRELPTRCVYADTAPLREGPSFSQLRRWCVDPP